MSAISKLLILAASKHASVLECCKCTPGLRLYIKLHMLSQELLRVGLISYMNTDHPSCICPPEMP